jgi:hypothetical protein
MSKVRITHCLRARGQIDETWHRGEERTQKKALSQARTKTGAVETPRGGFGSL